ncbi:MAG: hypothetical protein Q9213_007485 [Squamulea squamosa]
MSVPGYPNLAKIRLWAQDVAKETCHEPVSSVEAAHRMRLRPRPSQTQGDRQPLQKTSGNQRHQKRRLGEGTSYQQHGQNSKRQRTMGDEGRQTRRLASKPEKPSMDFNASQDPNFSMRPKRQGTSTAASPRRRQSPTKASSTFPSRLPPLGQLKSGPPLPRPDEPSSPEKSPSPGRRKEKDSRLDSASVKSTAPVTLQELGTFSPPVVQMTMQSARSSGPVPASVEVLYKALTAEDSGFVPLQLKSDYLADSETPRKSREPPTDKAYLPPDRKQFPADLVPRLKASMARILGNAEWAHSNDAHEGQWGTLVDNIIYESTITHLDVISCNVERCAINPKFRMQLPTGDPILIDESTNATNADPEKPASSLSRMVDRCLALRLDRNDLKMVRKGFMTVQRDLRSLNQSQSFIKECAIFLDFELKKKSAARDPEVQLAIWAGAGLLKRWAVGWSTDIPMPGIVVNGHIWTCYLFYEQDKELIMLGPIDIGNTPTLKGTWQIYYQLLNLIDWGCGDYRRWFEKEVLGWTKRATGFEEEQVQVGGAVAGVEAVEQGCCY